MTKSPRLAIEQRLPAHVLAVKLEQVKRHQRHFQVVLLGVDQVEARHAVLTAATQYIGFLLEQAVRCRGLATGLDDSAMKADLLALAADLEQAAKRERED